MSVAGQSYLLFDGVLREQLLPWLYLQDEPLEVEPLYARTPWRELADIGPVLVQPLSPNGLMMNFEGDPTLQDSASVLRSKASIAAVADHLRQFIEVSDTLGSESLLRFADPLVAQHWLASYGPQVLSAVLGPIDEWRMAAHRGRWQNRQHTEWLSFHSSEPTTSSSPFRLSHLEEPQIQALEQAYQRRFADRLDSWLEQAVPDFREALGSRWGDWLTGQYQVAQAWGLTTERSIAIWLELHARLGDGVCSAEDGRYAVWLTDNPHMKRVPPDARIQAFEADFLNCQQKGLS